MEIGPAAAAVAAHASSDNGPPYRLPAVLDRLLNVRASVDGNHGPSHAGANAGGSPGPAPFELRALPLLAHAGLDNGPACCLPAVLDRVLEVGASVGHRALHAVSNLWGRLEPAHFKDGALALRVQASLNDGPAYRIAAVLNGSIERRCAYRLGKKKHEADDDQEQRCIPERFLHEDPKAVS